MGYRLDPGYFYGDALHAAIVYSQTLFENRPIFMEEHKANLVCEVSH